MPPLLNVSGRGVLWPVGCLAVSNKIQFHPEFWRDFTLPFAAPQGCRLLYPCERNMAHRSVGSGPGQEWLGNRWSPPVLALSEQTLGCARFGQGCSLFLEALETSREGPAFSFPSFTDGVILICYVFVRGFFCYYYLFISCLLFMALDNQSQNTAEAEGKLWAHLPGGQQAASLQTGWGRECLSATKCLCWVSRQ